jgi:hypothetical protein
VTGSGDIAPVTQGPGHGVSGGDDRASLVGAFVRLIGIVVVAAMFFSTEYRRGLIRTTLAAAVEQHVVGAAQDTRDPSTVTVQRPQFVGDRCELRARRQGELRHGYQNQLAG